MGLYERLLEERAEEEQRRGEPLPKVRGLESKVLVRRLEDSEGRPGYAADLSMMYLLMTKLDFGHWSGKGSIGYARRQSTKKGDDAHPTRCDDTTPRPLHTTVLQTCLAAPSQLLLAGAILAPSKRTVSAALRAAWAWWEARGGSSATIACSTAPRVVEPGGGKPGAFEAARKDAFLDDEGGEPRWS